MCPLVGALFVGAPVRPNMLNMPKSASVTISITICCTVEHSFKKVMSQ